jgi:hypothetical protein
MRRKKHKTGTWGGAGSSETWSAQEGPGEYTHWFNLSQSWIDRPDDRYFSIPVWWREAIKSPGIVIHVRLQGGSTFAQFVPERGQILAGVYDCPLRYSHHLYQTCNCCGQYG